MAILKSSSENLTLNADGSGNDIIFQSNGVQKASLTDGGVFTATSFAGSGANLTGVGVTGIVSNANATAMTIDSSERIGIGTTSPQNPLEIAGNGNYLMRITQTGTNKHMFKTVGNGASMDFLADGANNYVGFNSTTNGDSISFQTNDGNERMRIDSNGNIGIGVIPKAWRSVQTALDFGTYGGIASHSSGYTELSHNYYDDGTDKYKNTNEAARILMQNNGTIAVQQAVSGSANAAVSWNTNLVFEVDGRGLSQFTAKAWVNFNGTGSVAIRDSHNVGSITDNATGNYSVNFTVNLANSNFAALGNSTKSGGSASASNSSATYIGEGRSTNYVSVETYRADGSTARDSTFINVAVFGD